jgi:pyruvate dehydrogenase (quinone)
MPRTVADDLWHMLAQAGVRRCYGIVGDALTPTMAALTRRSDIEFIHVRNEEWGTFAASADARLSDVPVAVCGTAGPGTAHLLNGLLGARHERSKVIAIVGDAETPITDTDAIEETSPNDLFRIVALYSGRLVNPERARAVIQRALSTTVNESGPTVIAVPGDVAGAKSPLEQPPEFVPPARAAATAAGEDVEAVAALVNEAPRVAILGGDGCAEAGDEVLALAPVLRAPGQAHGALGEVVEEGTDNLRLL